MSFTPTVVFDFDGVIHSYTSGWQGVNEIHDPVVPGIKEAVDDIRAAGYKVVVVSTRCADPYGLGAVRRYLKENGITVDEVMMEKPPAICYIDDRAICFDGIAETLPEKIRNFKNWIEQAEEQRKLEMELLSKIASGELRERKPDATVKRAVANPKRTERRCKCKYYDAGELVPDEGYFLGWGIDYEECGVDVGVFSAAIVERYDGTVITAPANTVEFLS